ncbi:nonstructural protein 1 [Galliform chaphamaparvovirus 17]|nr:nonstructural protein 1 [Galliform chaphamaparvovirus 17]
MFSNFDADPSAIHKVLLHQGIQPVMFDEVFNMWINKLDSKKNCIVLYGPSNTGKTAFISGLKSTIPWGEVVNTETFAFEGILESAIAVWEEPLISAALAEKTKQVLEGMECSVPVKYKKPQRLKRTPIIMTTNHYPWRFCSNEETAFRNRMWFFEFHHNCHGVSYTPRTSEHRCECPYCKASSSCSSASGESVSCEMQRAKQPLSTGEQWSIRTVESAALWAGSMSDPGEGTSRSYYCSYGSSSSGAEVRSTDSSRPSSSTSSSTEQQLRCTGYGSSSSRDRAHSSSTSTQQHMVAKLSARDYGYDCSGNRDIRSWLVDRRRNDRPVGDNLPSGTSLSTLASRTLSDQTQKTIQVPAKKRKLDRKMGTLTTTEMRIPSRQDWQQYFSWIYNYYG